MFLTTQGQTDGIWDFDIFRENTLRQIPNSSGLGFNAAAAIGNTLYLTGQGNNGIWKYEIGSNAKPTQIASTKDFGFLGITANDNTLYLSSQNNGTSGIWSFDTTQESMAPIQLKYSNGYMFVGLVYFNGYLYLTGLGTGGGVWKYNINQHNAPNVINATRERGFLGITVIGVHKKIYLAGQGEKSGIWSLKTTTGAKLKRDGLTKGKGFNWLIAVGDLLYLTGQGSTGIWIYDTNANRAPWQLPLTNGLGFSGITKES